MMKDLVMCGNKDCDQFGVRKEISYPPVGAGLFLGGSVVCRCGYQVLLVEHLDPGTDQGESK